MTISIWRFSHLALAVSSFLFIALASVTGIILAFDPVSQKIQPYRADHFNQLSLADAIPAIKEKYADITELTVDANQFVIVHGSDTAGNSVVAYVSPETGQQLGIQEKKKCIFSMGNRFPSFTFFTCDGPVFYWPYCLFAAADSHIRHHPDYQAAT